MWHVQKNEAGWVEEGVEEATGVGVFHIMITVMHFWINATFLQLKKSAVNVMTVNLNGLREKLIKNLMHIFSWLNF